MDFTIYNNGDEPIELKFTTIDNPLPVTVTIHKDEEHDFVDVEEIVHMGEGELDEGDSEDDDDDDDEDNGDSVLPPMSSDDY